ncbi:hypothetical protein B5V01_29130 [Mesorhizobium erdmanii]|nr:hypothetical protein B5V01_29130 [Mesorhizobium erdmanii]
MRDEGGVGAKRLKGSIGILVRAMVRQGEHPHAREFIPVGILPVAKVGRLEQLGVAGVEPRGLGAACRPSMRPMEDPMLMHIGADDRCA